MLNIHYNIDCTSLVLCRDKTVLLRLEVLHGYGIMSREEGRRKGGAEREEYGRGGVWEGRGGGEGDSRRKRGGNGKFMT